MTAKRPVILVHGAWHGAWCWNQVSLLLNQAGHKVASPDLPGHGHNPLPLKAVSLARYVKHIYSYIEQSNEPVILVGHSMAGIIISALAEMAPNKIHCLIYVNAYLPSNGDSIFSIMQTHYPDSAIARAMTLSSDKRSYSLDQEAFKNLFYHSSPPKLAESALTFIQAQASLPLGSTVKLSNEKFGTVKKVILCSPQDRVIPPLLKRRMLQQQACNEFIQIQGDHSLFYSAPEDVAAVINAQ